MTERIRNLLAGTTTINICPLGKGLIVLTIVFAIAIIYSYTRALGDADSALYGLWEVDSSFAERADVDSMYLFISPPTSDGKKLASVSAIGLMGREVTGYMLIKADGQTVFSGALKKMRLRRTSIRADAIHKYALDLGQSVSCIPQHLALEYDSCTGMMTLMSGKTMYARLFKKPEASYYTALGGQEIDDPTDDIPTPAEAEQEDQDPEKNEKQE